MRKSLALAALIAAAVSAAAAIPASASNSVTVSFVSGPDWSVFTEDPGPAASGRGKGLGFLGAAQDVCLNASSPSPCPSGALLYGFPASGWFADLSSIRGAAWVWAPGITGETTPSEFATYYFSKAFVIDGKPTAGTVYLSADDFAEVRVNGIAVGSVGSVTDIGLAEQAQTTLTAFDVSSLLKPGKNVITIKGQNGPPNYSPFCSTTCSYAQNPAGVVFGGSVSFTQDA